GCRCLTSISSHTLATGNGPPVRVARCLVAVPAVPSWSHSRERIHAMNVPETTNTFLEFFTDRGHRVLRGSSLVPPGGDPVLFTTSGMHPLAPYLEGLPHPQGRRLTSVQRCMRTTDLAEVGDDRHLTMFQ